MGEINFNNLLGAAIGIGVASYGLKKLNEIGRNEEFIYVVYKEDRRLSYHKSIVDAKKTADKLRKNGFSGVYVTREKVVL